MEDGKPVPGSYYIYAPNKIAPVFFTVAFAVSGLVHLWQCHRYKCFKLTALHLLCSLLFTVGFALREYGAFHYNDLYTYIASTMLIYLAPPLLELANYHVLGRILYYIPYFAPMHPGRTMTTFGTLSGLIEVLNAVGVTYITNKWLPERVRKLGDILMKTGLILQLGVFAFFILMAGVFHQRCIRAGIKTTRVTAPLLTLYISTVIILTRTIYRIVEYFTVSSIHVGSGFSLMMLSPIVRYEWYFYVFEASLMLSNSVLWNVRHPRRYLPENYHIYLAQDGVTELEGPGWKDKRSWIMTAMDPFGWCEPGERKERPFWETNGFAGANGRV